MGKFAEHCTRQCSHTLLREKKYPENKIIYPLLWIKRIHPENILSNSII